MWPFKGKCKTTLEEFAASQPPAPCGDQREHTYWVMQGWPCPVCAANKQRAEEEATEDRMAEKIAAAVVRLLNSADRAS